MFVYLMMMDSQEDQSKFEKVYLTYRGLMYHVAYKILNNKHDAEDVVHSAFIKVAENIQKIGDPVCPKTQNYVVTIVENKAIDLYRANKRKNSSLYLDEISGIDVGSETHYARAFDWRNIEFSKKPFAFSNDEAGFTSFKAWLEDIKEKFGKTIVLPGMEPTGHYWFHLGAFLQDNGMKPVHVNPHHVHKSKELDDNNPSKNDCKDPKTIAALVNEGRFNYPYIPTGVYAEIRSLYGLQVMTQEALIRVKNRIARWLSIYFPEYKDVYRSCDAISGVMVLKVCPLPADIVMLGADGVNKIWRDAKLRAAGMKRARTLVEAAQHSVGSTESPEAAKYEMELLLGDYDVYTKRLEELTEKIEAKLEEIPYVDKLLEIKGVGKNIVSGLIAVACKALRVFYAILTKGVSYDGKFMLESIRYPESQVLGKRIAA